MIVRFQTCTTLFICIFLDQGAAGVVK